LINDRSLGSNGIRNLIQPQAGLVQILETEKGSQQQDAQENGVIFSNRPPL
jgi:hypothetical protein